MNHPRSNFYRYLQSDLRWEGDNRVPDHVERVAVVAQFSLLPKVTRSFASLVNELRQGGYFVLVSSACPAPDPLEWPAGFSGADVAVLRKPNIGYDFGSWAAAMLHAPQVFEAQRLLQVNDSLAGPFWSLSEILDDFANSKYDYWGMIRSEQFVSHLQSYFVGYTSEVLQSRAFRQFWTSVRVEQEKDDVIRRYELGLGRMLYSEGFTADAFLDSRAIVAPGDNPMIHGWEQALEVGVPFVKRELLMRPDVIPGADRAPLVLQEKYGVDWTEWV